MSQASDSAAPLERVRRVLPGYLAGRCSSGGSRDTGRLYHAVEAWVRPGAGEGYLNAAAALCGATYGRRSAGFFQAPAGTAYTCRKCAKRAAALVAADPLTAK